VPCCSADCLAILVKKCRKAARNPGTVMALVHPILMNNILVGVDGTMRLRNKKYYWERGWGWLERTKS